MKLQTLSFILILVHSRLPFAVVNNNKIVYCCSCIIWWASSLACQWFVLEFVNEILRKCSFHRTNLHEPPSAWHGIRSIKKEQEEEEERANNLRQFLIQNLNESDMFVYNTAQCDQKSSKMGMFSLCELIHRVILLSTVEKKAVLP